MCVYLGTSISLVGLGIASFMYITPNKGSGAPSVSSMKDRASGFSRDCLRDNRRWRGEKRELFCVTGSNKCVSSCREQLFSPALVIEINFLWRPLFQQLAHNGLKLLWKDTTSRANAFVSASPSSQVLTIYQVVHFYPGEWHTVGGRRRRHHTGAGRRGRGRSEVVADRAEAAGPAPARSPWCHRCTDIRFFVTRQSSAQ